MLLSSVRTLFYTAFNFFHPSHFCSRVFITCSLCWLIFHASSPYFTIPKHFLCFSNFPPELRQNNFTPCCFLITSFQRFSTFKLWYILIIVILFLIYFSSFYKSKLEFFFSFTSYFSEWVSFAVNFPLNIALIMECDGNLFHFPGIVWSSLLGDKHVVVISKFQSV